MMRISLMLGPFDLPYVQRALVEIALLSAGASVLGTWVVLRGLSFYAHATATATFPGLVLAAGLGFSPLLGAAATAGALALGVAALGDRRDAGRDTATALVLVAALAAGVVLASDVFHSQGSIESLLFGSLLTIDLADQAAAAAVGALALILGAVLGARWLAVGFDPAAARALGVRSPLFDAALLALVAAMAVVTVQAVGALLAGALLVVPAATTRLLVDRVGRWQLATAALALAEGAVGLWLAVELNAPPGATIAVLSAAVFAAVAIARTVADARPGRLENAPAGTAAP
jgi:ABC-type Mn2+/Zn2+ transport system permease subunit